MSAWPSSTRIWRAASGLRIQGGPDPVGQHLIVGGLNPRPVTIVGVAADVHQSLEGTTWPDSVYVPLTQSAPPFGVLAVRTAGPPLSFTGAIRAQVLAVDPDQPISDVQTMDDRVEAQVGQKRLLEILLGSFAAVALLLALTGIYGVIAYSVAQRTQELGIRRALGARESDILRLLISQGLALVVAGVSLGLGGAFALTRLMNTMLFQVSTTDPLTFALVAFLFLAAALAASFIPAQTARGQSRSHGHTAGLSGYRGSTRFFRGCAPSDLPLSAAIIS
jgi:putative ABC transport system permease protein